MVIEYNEYWPMASQCQMYTAALAYAAQPRDTLRSERLRVSGTPFAVPVMEPIEERMSLRTIPLSVRMFTPLVPSPGKGPPVSGATAAHVPLAATAVLALIVAVVFLLDFFLVVAANASLAAVPTNNAEAPKAPAARNSRRRVIITSCGSVAEKSAGLSMFWMDVIPSSSTTPVKGP